MIKSFLKEIKFNEAQSIMYDPKKFLSKWKQDNTCGIFEHYEVEGLRSFTNLQIVDKDISMINPGNRVQDTQEVPIQLNPLAMDIETPMKNDSVNKRAFDEIVCIERQDQSFNKRVKIVIKEKDIVNLDDGDELINHEGIRGCAIAEEQEKEHNISHGSSSSSLEQTLSQNVVEARKSQPVFQYESYLFSQAQPTQYKSKNEIIK